MESKVRLDGEGNPYLVITYQDREGEDSNAQEDAERLFFRKFNQNGGTLHLVPGKDKTMRFIVVLGGTKRKTSVAESFAIGPVEAREEDSANSREIDKTLKEAETLLKDLKSTESSESDDSFSNLREES